ncbi:MAG: ABC transporter permease [Acidobacteriota bacterium]
MKWQRLAAVARKETLHVKRDPRALIVGIAIPIMLLVLFGYALSLDVDRVPLVVWDQSQTPASRELISRFEGSRYFALKSYVTGYGAITDNLDKGDAVLALVIPADFTLNLGGPAPAHVQLIADGSDSNTATLAIGYAEAVTQKFSNRILLSEIRRLGRKPPPEPVNLAPRVWYNKDLQSRNFIIPGLIAVIMMIIAALLTSLTVAREWETGTIEPLLTTPLKGAELVLGKLFPYFVIGLFDLAVSVIMGRFLFHVPLRGSVWLLLIQSVIFLVGALCLGMVISIVSKTQLMASQLSFVITFLPAFLLSGFILICPPKLN